MSSQTIEAGGGSREDMFEDRVSRGNTGVRILLTILFFVISRVVGTVLGVIVLFGLIWALITRQAPPMRLRGFSNQLIAYGYRIARYLTYNEARVPFPFSEFPRTIEPPDEIGEDDAEEVHALLREDTLRDEDPDLD